MECEKANLSFKDGYIQRRISSAIVDCFGQRLVGQITQVGPGALLASQRRQGWTREEEMARQDREALWLDNISSNSIIRKGRFWSKPTE